VRWNLPVGSFTDWEELPVGTDCLFYEGLHGAVTDRSTPAATSTC
jgi:phosphoribulokinase